MASFASYVTMGGARKHAWTKKFPGSYLYISHMYKINGERKLIIFCSVYNYGYKHEVMKYTKCCQVMSRTNMVSDKHSTDLPRQVSRTLSVNHLNAITLRWLEVCNFPQTSDSPYFEKL